MRGMRIGLTVFSLMLVLSFSSVALATMGESATTVQTDMSHLQGHNLQVTSNSVYTTYTFQARGDVIKEFANTDGVIFALTWRGRAPLNMRGISGKHYQAYRAMRAMQPHLHVRHPIIVKTPLMTVYRGGHMRDWMGLAYMKSLAPSGVSERDLR